MYLILYERFDFVSDLRYLQARQREHVEYDFTPHPTGVIAGGIDGARL